MMGKNLYVGCRVRILYSVSWPFLKGKEGVIVDKLGGEVYSPHRPDVRLEWEVSVDDWGGSETPINVSPHGWFCPTSDQLEPILPRGLESGEEIDKLYEPTKEFVPCEEYEDYNMKKYVSVICLSFLLAGCGIEESRERTRYQQLKRQEIFKDCLSRIPKGPERTHYNDWNEVISTCDDVAYVQSLYSIPPSAEPKPTQPAGDMCEQRDSLLEPTLVDKFDAYICIRPQGE